MPSRPNNPIAKVKTRGGTVQVKATPALVAALGLKPKRKAPKSAFKKGQPRPANAGRKKGTKNKFTTDMKAAVMEAFNRLGGADFFVAIGKSKVPSNRRALVGLFGKMLPLELTGENGGAIIIHAAPEDKNL